MRVGVYDVCEAPLADLKWTSEHFLRLPPSPSPHGMAVVRQRSGPAHLLVASSGKIFLIKSNGSGELVKQVIDLPCVEASSEIPSVEAHVDALTGDLHYAFTVCTKSREGAVGYSLHVHTQRGCQEVVVGNRPHQLLFCGVPCAGGEQGVWVLGGEQVTVVGPPMVTDDTTTVAEESQTSTFVNSAHLDASNDAEGLLREDEDRTDDEDEEENECDDEEEDDDEEEMHEKYWEDDDSRDHRGPEELGNPTDHFPAAKCRSPLKRRGAEGGDKRAGPEKQGGEGAPCDGQLTVLSTSVLFPELAALPFTAVCIHALRTPDLSRRITAVCGDDGSVRVCDVSLEDVPNSPPSHYVTAEASFLRASTDASRSPEAFSTPSASGPLDPPSVSTPKHPNSTPSKRPLGPTPSKTISVPCVSPCQDSGEVPHDTPSTGTVRSLEAARPLKAAVTGERRFKFEYPMSSVALFRMTDPREPYPDTLPPLRGVAPSSPDPRTPLYSLLATSAVSRSYVLWDVLDEAETCSAALPESGDHDTVVCCLSAHLGGDRQRHLLLGTYGQTVLVYAAAADEGADEDCDEAGAWVLVTKLHVGAPVLGLAFEDIVGDGVRRVIVLTADGVQVFVLEPQLVTAVLTQRLHQLLRSHSSCAPSAAAPPTPHLQAVTRSLNF